MQDRTLDLLILFFQLALAVVTWKVTRNGKGPSSHAIEQPREYADEYITRREAEHSLRSLAHTMGLAVTFLQRGDSESAVDTIREWKAMRDAKNRG